MYLVYLVLKYKFKQTKKKSIILILAVILFEIILLVGFIMMFKLFLRI